MDQHDISSYGIFQIRRRCAIGEMYHFICYNNDENVSGEIKRRPYLLIDDAIGYAHKYKFLPITSRYVKGESIPLPSNTNERISFISLSSIVEMKYNSIKGNRSGMYYSTEFIDMVKAVLLYKYINAPIQRKYVNQLNDYLDTYNKQVDEGAFTYDGILPHIYLPDIIDLDRVNYYGNITDNNHIIATDIIGRSEESTSKAKKKSKEDTNSTEEEVLIVSEYESVYSKDILYIRECLDPDKENKNILSAFNAYKEHKCDIKSLASSANIPYDKAKYYIRFIDNEPAIKRSIAYRNKLKERKESIEIAQKASEEVDEILNGCNYKVKQSKKRRHRRRKR